MNTRSKAISALVAGSIIYQPYQISSYSEDDSHIIMKKALPEKNNFLESARGVYLSSWRYDSKTFDLFMASLKEAGLNTIVVDIKNNSGEILYQSSSEIGRSIHAIRPALGRLEDLVSHAHERGFYVIARQVVFNDPLLAKKRPETAVKTEDGTVWSGEMKNYFVPWASPASQIARQYNLDIAREAAQAGVDEIQFDYIRFPAKNDLIFPGMAKGSSKKDTLLSFLAEARQAVVDKKTLIGIDVFGFTIVATDDLGIGQNFVDLTKNVDVISPMLYPSHYTRGNFGFEKPQDHPYEVISGSLKMANRLIVSDCSVMPWIQAFGWNTPAYDKEYIKAQVRAVRDGGAKTYLFWNAGGEYNLVIRALKEMKLAEELANSTSSK